MRQILRSLPFYAQENHAVAPGVYERVRAHQVIVWVSVTAVGVRSLPGDAGRFPAILDSGHNDIFTIKPTHLRQWTGKRLSEFPEDAIRILGKDKIEVPTRRANVWLHPNTPDKRDEVDSNNVPYCIEVESGIIVMGDYEQVGNDARTKTLAGFRLPLLGLRGLVEGRCQLHVDCEKLRLDLEAP
jgi:hypothetical protein